MHTSFLKKKKKKDDLKKIKSPIKVLILPGKYKKAYMMEPITKLSITSWKRFYRKESSNIVYNINLEAKNITDKLKVDNHLTCITKLPLFITLKENFRGKLDCRLLKPAKRFWVKIGKKWLKGVCGVTRSIINQPMEIYQCYPFDYFNSITDKQVNILYSFISVFYPFNLVISKRQQNFKYD